MKRVFVSLGGNIGDVKNTLATALQQIKQLSGVFRLSVSRLYFTSPVGEKERPYYYNAVCAFDYANSAQTLLQELQGIENRLGRVRTGLHSPRTCDLDILLFGDDIVQIPLLEIPHPRMYERLFVLIPLLELIPSDARALLACKNLQKIDSGTVVPAGNTAWWLL
jgi:2-amino-4-hydroxy-6-hydroxymethyldihydropteridine diphosphokinase